MSVIELLRSDGSIIVNKKLAHVIGIEPAIMYSELISKQIYFEERSQLTDDGFFFNTVENMQEDTTLSKYQQSKAMKKLKELKLVEQSNRGVPQKRYFKVINDDMRLLQILGTGKKLKNSTSKSKKVEQLKVNKVSSNNTKINNTKEIKYNIIASNDAFALQYYNDKYFETFGKNHPRISNEQLDDVVTTINEFQIEEGITNEDWIDTIDEHFDTLAVNNDGNCLAFFHGDLDKGALVRKLDIK